VRVAIGVAHGRFQPLHIGHLEYLLAARAACDLLVVGITNPDPWQVRYEPTDPARSDLAANPCTYYERQLMVEAAMTGFGVDRAGFRVVPFPHSYPERLHHYLPAGAVMLMTVYDEWGEAKLRRFEEQGLPVRVLWRRQRKITSATAVREAIRRGEPWEHLVPAGVDAVLRDLGIAERIRAAAGPGEPEEPA
jgi:cytidyltransferase-like protein